MSGLQRDTDNSTTTAGDFNIPISISDRIRDKKVSKETDDLNITANHVDLIEVYGSQHPENAKYAFFQMHMVCLPKQTTCETTEQVSINVKGMKSHSVCL